MKRLICAAVIIVTVCTVAVLGSKYVNKTLDEIVFTAENEPGKLEELWQQKRGLLSVFMNNGDIDAIEEQIYSAGEEQELTAVVKSVMDSERFNLENIL